jgi:hypothetical protein
MKTATAKVKEPGTYSVASGQRLDFKEARSAWSAAGRPVLEAVAMRYAATITYQELADEVQQVSGIRTRMQIRHWIGNVLGSIARDCHEAGEPVLSSLCVHADGTIGDGFARAIAQTYGETVGDDDIEMRGAEERLACYRHFGAVLPAEGGRPMLTPEVAAKREKRTHVAAPYVPPQACPACHLILPKSGRCSNCAST